jgi:hypothetical protein
MLYPETRTESLKGQRPGRSDVGRMLVQQLVQMASHHAASTNIDLDCPHDNRPIVSMAQRRGLKLYP